MSGHAGGVNAPPWRVDAKLRASHGGGDRPGCPVPARRSATTRRLVLLDDGRRARAARPRPGPPAQEPRLLPGLPGLRPALRADRPQHLACCSSCSSSWAATSCACVMERRRGVLGRALPHAAPARLPPDGGGARAAAHGRGQRPHPADRRPLVQRGRGAHPLLARRRSAPPCATRTSTAAASTRAALAREIEARRPARPGRAGPPAPRRGAARARAAHRRRERLRPRRASCWPW